MDKNFIRQGDLLFIPRAGDEPFTGNSKPVADGIIAEGEATGHHHRLAVLEDAEVFSLCNGDKVAKAGPNGVSIVHEEHKTVSLAPNTIYEVHRAREFDYLATAARFVAD